MRNLILYGGCKLTGTTRRQSGSVHMLEALQGANWPRIVSELSGRKLDLITSLPFLAAFWTVGQNEEFNPLSSPFQCIIHQVNLG